MHTIAGTTGLACCPRRMAHRIVLFLNAAILGPQAACDDSRQWRSRVWHSSGVRS